MKTPRERYQNDVDYKKLVDVLCAQIHSCYFTPSELRSAAVLACILYEEMRIRPMLVPFPPGIEKALDRIHDWTTSGERE